MQKFFIPDNSFSSKAYNLLTPTRKRRDSAPQYPGAGTGQSVGDEERASPGAPGRVDLTNSAV